MITFRTPDPSAEPALSRVAATLATATLATALLATALLAAGGCTLREPADPLVAEPPATQDAPPAVTPTAPPAPPAPEAIAVALGEEASAGAWRIVVREAELVEKVGDLSAAGEGARLLKVEILLLNTIDSDLRVSPIDFSVTDGITSTFPLSSADPGLDPAREIPAGKGDDFKAVFGIPEDMAGRALTLVFEPSEGGPARIEIALQ